MTDFEKLKSIFVKNQKCIVNSDLDGLLSGMLLQEFLNWEIVGFSSCAGKPDDEIWLKDDNIKINECVFVEELSSGCDKKNEKKLKKIAKCMKKGFPTSESPFFAVCYTCKKPSC